MESPKLLKEKILAALLRNELNNADLNALAEIAASVKRIGISISVDLPTDPSADRASVSIKALELAEKFAGQYGYTHDVVTFARKWDSLFGALQAPVPSHQKIQGIKVIREHTGLGLADAKWVVENIFGA